MKLRTLAFALAGLTSIVVPTAVNADTPGRHPAYLHARSDLRAAQLLMRVREEPNVRRQLTEADRETEAAIAEIDRAAVIDHKDVDDHPRVDIRLERMARLHRTVDLLREARADLAREEDNGRAREWRNAAFRHIDAALEHIHRASVDLHWDHELGF
jgi:hypothetical protein